MLPTMTIKRAAQNWSLSERRVNELCRNGRIEGAYKENGRWVIPASAKKPVDERYKISSPPIAVSQVRKPLPIGISEFKKVVSEYYYVDKTLLIKEILDEKAVVSVFTRPRAFGKSLNMDMLRTFFELSSEDISAYFRDKAIWEENDDYRLSMGKYPVVYLDFRSVRDKEWSAAYTRIARIITDEYDRHREIMDSDKCSPMDNMSYTKILTGRYSTKDLTGALYLLTKMLHDFYDETAVVIIDEYDLPLKTAWDNGYYSEASDFFRQFYYEGFQENRHLRFAYIAGILNIRDIFKDISNIKFNTVLDKRYGKYFGFTWEEVEKIVELYDAEAKEREIKNWYAVYQFGDTEVYSPWSIVNYFNDDMRPLAFWENTGDNDIINLFLDKADLAMLEQLEVMMQNRNISVRIDASAITGDDDDDPGALYSYMVATGYFKAVRADLQFDGDYMCDITIPNREVSFMFGKKILNQFEAIIPKATAVSMREAIYRADTEALRRHIYNLIIQTIGFNSADSDRIFYHGLVLGLCSMLGNRYHVETICEAETGNFSIEMVPLEIRLPGILILTKCAPGGTADQLEALARFACKQINNRQTENEGKARYMGQALKYGVAFSGTALRIIVE